jgi:hypothetical protein
VFSHPDQNKNHYFFAPALRRKAATSERLQIIAIDNAALFRHYPVDVDIRARVKQGADDANVPVQGGPEKSSPRGIVSRVHIHAHS